MELRAREARPPCGPHGCRRSDEKLVAGDHQAGHVVANLDPRVESHTGTAVGGDQLAGAGGDLVCSHMMIFEVRAFGRLKTRRASSRRLSGTEP